MTASQTPSMTPAITAVAPGARIQRFTRTERAVHWVQASSFLLLLISGFILELPAFEATIGHRALLREIHLASAFFFFFGPALIALSGNRPSVGRDVAAVDTWDADDARWLIPAPVRKLLGMGAAPQGRFNAGQKLNAIFIVWSTLTFTVTGLIMWQNRRFDTALVSHANTIHTALAYLALVAFLGHLYLGTAYPKTRHAFRAITQGWVSAQWAELHHVKWVRNPGRQTDPPSHDALRTTVQIVLGGAACLLATRVYFFSLGANVTDKVTSVLYALTAWPGSSSVRPQTGVHVADWTAVGYAIGCAVAWLAIDQMRRLHARQASGAFD